MKGEKKRSNRAIRSNPSMCYLCGLPIPNDIVTPSHPLFGTIDHIIRTSRNGPDAAFNRAPAHRLCNARKGDQIIDPEQFAAERHQEMIPLLESFGRKFEASRERRQFGGSCGTGPRGRRAKRKKSGTLVYNVGQMVISQMAVSREFQADVTCARRPSALAKRSALRDAATCKGTPPSGPWVTGLGSFPI